MARQTTVLQVFVASPSDVADERDLLESVIAQLNQTWSSSLGITFELLRWETSVRPTFSTDPQAAINQQIGDDYDIFIGIFWGRLGTSTPRAESGTIEEFEAAFERRRKTGDTPEIMLYFKDAAIPPSKTKPDQLQKVLDFKNSLSERGGLYSVFEDHAGFESSLRSHLSAVATSFASKKEKATLEYIPADSTKSKSSEIELEEDDYGYIDYLEIYESRQYDMVSAISIINEATVRIGEQIGQRATEINNGANKDAKEMRRLVKRIADDMNNYAETMKPQISALTSAREDAFGALSNALALHRDFSNKNDDLINLRATLKSLIDSTNVAESGMVGMRTTTAALPKISKDTNKAKRAVVHELDTFLSEVESTRSTINNIIESIDRMLTIN